MPKFLKTKRIELWRTTEDFQDAAGSWHRGKSTQIANLWSNLKGRDFSMLYEQTGRWADPTFDLTITRGKFTVPRVGDHIRCDGKFYIVRAINDLTGQVGHDMRITVELDEEFYTTTGATGSTTEATTGATTEATEATTDAEGSGD